MKEFALVNYRDGQAAPQAGFVCGERVFSFPERVLDIPITTLAEVYDHWEKIAPQLATLPRTLSRPLADVALLPPSLQPSAIYCAGINYQDHVDAVYRRQNIPAEPSLVELGQPSWHFLKARNTLRAHKARIPLYTSFIDWEIELAAVIGRTARYVAEEEALDYVAGYTVAIDLSERRSNREGLNIGSPFRIDWLRSKSFEGACPLGPWLVPAHDISDPNDLPLRLSVNGVVRQDSNTAKMLHSTAAQIAHLSAVITLSPGDVVLTGTPAGTGFETDEYLQPGDVISATIGEIGELVVTMTNRQEALRSRE